MIGTWMEWWSATVPLCKESLLFYWIVQIAKHIFIFYYVFTVGSDGLFNRYDTVPMPTQMVRPTPTYFSQLGNDGVERLPFNLKEVTSYNKSHKATYGSLATDNKWVYSEWKLSGDLLEVRCKELKTFQSCYTKFITQLRLCTVYTDLGRH